MAITFDQAKRDRARAERGPDFEDADELFCDPAFEFEDKRRDYGERRIVTIGFVAGRMTIVIWTQCGADRHVISTGKADVRGQKRYAPLIR